MNTTKSELQNSQLTVPKGGGAIKGIGETFQPNAFSGTGSFSIPFPVSPARGLEPELTLSYNSGAGNGVFGMGFTVSQPVISRRTEKGLPKYDATDVFLFAGSELVPKLKQVNGKWIPEVQTGVMTEGKTWNIYTYMPRVEGSFSLIQHWVEQSNNESWWKVTGRDQSILTFGRSTNSRVANPTTPSKIFEWLLQEHLDTKGNKILYTYAIENNIGIPADGWEQKQHAQCTNRYLQRIQYGNYYDTNQTEQFAFELIFDYGERNLTDAYLSQASADAYTTVQPWALRDDSFSTFKSGFEVRTRRLCQNILQFHRFAELGNNPSLVRRLKINYAFATLNTMSSVELIGYRQTTNGSYEIQKTPSLDLEFSLFRPNTSGDFKQLKSGSGTIPGSIDHAQFLPVDLYREGIDGFIYSVDNTVYYFEPLGNGVYKTPLAEDHFPNETNWKYGQASFTDVNGDGHLDLAVENNSTSTAGFYQKNENGQWSNFKPFTTQATDVNNVLAEHVGLSGNGKTDLLLIEDDSITFYPSLGSDGYAAPITREKPIDFPQIKKTYAQELVTFTGVFGDGLSHRVRIANGIFECWPNLGYGNFGKKISLANAPDFGDDFQINRLFLADVDGSGTPDLIYVYRDRVALYINQNGNGFAEPVYITLPETYSDIDQIHFADVLGNGTSCLVFSKNDIQPRHYYYEFTGATVSKNGTVDKIIKPYLLIGSNNNMGASHRINYVSSVKFYLADKQAGTPWLQPLPFPVQVVEESIATDEVTGSRMVHRYSYHDGFYDHIEKEFRGFGYVETWDTETLETRPSNYLTSTSVANIVTDKLFVPPIYTRTWHHNGLFIDSEKIKSRYYSGDVNALSFPDSFFENSVFISRDEETVRQAYAAMHGHVLRSEVYGLDGTTAQQHPYTVTESNLRIKLLQDRFDMPYAVFTVSPRESIAYHYERNPDDPRIQQEFVLETDEFENVKLACSVALARRSNATKQIYPEQQSIKATATTTNFRNTTKDFWLIGIPYEIKTFELSGIRANTNGYCSFQDFSRQANDALQQKIPNETAFSGTTLQSHILSWERIYFWNDSLTDFLELGKLTMLALHHHSESAAFAQTFVQQKFNSRVTNTTIDQDGGYGFDIATALWWNRGVVSYFSNAMQFYIPVKTENSFAPTSSSLRIKKTLTYDQPYNLHVIREDNWLDDTTSIFSTSIVDYISLQAKQVTDENNNIHQVIFDPLGQVIVSSSYSFKGNVRLGGMSLYAENVSTPAVYQKRTLNTQGATISFADVVNDPNYYLQGASSYFFYDLFAWANASNKKPVSAISLIRENFYYIETGPSAFSCQTMVGYLDGFGRALEIKSRVETGPGFSRDASGNLIKDATNKPLVSALTDRWLVSGKTIYNNKGNPAEQYLSYYSNTPLYENQQDVVLANGTAPPTIIHYDPLSRVIRTDSPKGFFSKVEFTPWEEFHFDENDTVRNSEYYTANYLTNLNADEKDAIDKASKFYYTPKQIIADNLGHVIRIVENNLGEFTPSIFSPIVNATTPTEVEIWSELLAKGYILLNKSNGTGLVTAKFQPYKTGFVFDLAAKFDLVKNAVSDVLRQSLLTSFYQYDIEGRLICSIDARLFYANVATGTTYYNFKNTYTIGDKQPIYFDSIDGGAEFHFNNIYGSLIWSWTARNFNQTIQYDRFQRRTQLRVAGYKDDGTLASDNIAEQFIYGESQANADVNNLRGQVYQIKDLSGVVTQSKYNLNGQVLSSSRQFASDYKNTVNWAVAVPLNTDVYLKTFIYDALGRLLSETSPDGTITQNSYNQRGLLTAVSVKHPSKATAQPIITAIEYNSNNHRTKVVYGNSSQTTYTYESTTLRLLQMQTTRNVASVIQTVQDIKYVYDPVGNLTRLTDNSFKTTFNNNQAVEPVSDYTYDALYRLIRSTGRQHPGVGINAHLNNKSSNDFKQSKFIASINDNTALENYTERYSYDEAGNLIKTIHQASNAWTRETNVQNNSNRLKNIVDTTTTSSSQEMVYDRSGNQKQLTLNNTIELTWICCENLTKAAIIQRPGELDDADYYTYDSSEMRTRKISERMSNQGLVTETEEKYYCGNYEEKFLKTISTTATTTTLRRQTIRVMDGTACVAVLHYWVTDTNQKEVDAAATLKLRYQYGNHLGSVALELDETAQLVSYEEYFPYGGTAYTLGKNQREVAIKEYRYSNKERDDSTGLYYYGARYYAPWLGRWLSADPAGTVDGMNVYAFVGGNPIGYVDLWGMEKRAHPDGDEKDREVSMNKKERRAATADVRNSMLKYFAKQLEYVKKIHQSKLYKGRRTQMVPAARMSDERSIVRHISTFFMSENKGFEEVQTAIHHGSRRIYIASNKNEVDLARRLGDAGSLSNLNIPQDSVGQTRREQRHIRKLRGELNGQFGGYQLIHVRGFAEQHAETKILESGFDFDYVGGTRRPCLACTIKFLINKVHHLRFNPHPGRYWDGIAALMSLSEDIHKLTSKVIYGGIDYVNVNPESRDYDTDSEDEGEAPARAARSPRAARPAKSPGKAKRSASK